MGKETRSLWECKDCELFICLSILKFHHDYHEVKLMKHNLQLLGFFGGVHLAVLSAFICQRHPTASLSALFFIFFKTFAFWPWPTPVILQDGVAWPFIPTDKVLWMPIQLPCSPYQFCHSNTVRSTFFIIKSELLRGHTLTKVCAFCALIC